MEKQKSRRKWTISIAITIIASILLTIFAATRFGYSNGKFKLVLSPSSVTLPRWQECNLTLNVISTGYEGNVTFSLSLSRPEYGFIVNRERGLEDLFLKAYQNKTITIPVSARSDAKLMSHSVFVSAHASSNEHWVFRVDSNVVNVNVQEEIAVRSVDFCCCKLRAEREQNAKKKR